MYVLLYRSFHLFYQSKKTSFFSLGSNRESSTDHVRRFLLRTLLRAFVFVRV